MPRCWPVAVTAPPERKFKSHYPHWCSCRAAVAGIATFTICSFHSCIVQRIAWLENYSAASCAAQLSPEVRDLLDRILVPDEKERITVAQIQAHPWCAPRFSSVAQHTCLLHFCAFHAQTSPRTKAFTLGKCRMPVPLPYSYPTGGEFSRMSAGICCRRYCSGWNRM